MDADDAVSFGCRVEFDCRAPAIDDHQSPGAQGPPASDEVIGQSAGQHDGGYDEAEAQIPLLAEVFFESGETFFDSHGLVSRSGRAPGLRGVDAPLQFTDRWHDAIR